MTNQKKVKPGKVAEGTSKVEKLAIPHHRGGRLHDPACAPRYYRGHYWEGTPCPPQSRWTAEERAAYEAKVDWFHKAKYGLMFHFTTNMTETPSDQRTSGWTSGKWNAWIDAVDVEKVADQAQEIGAGYVMICITQTGQYHCAPNPVLQEHWKFAPGQYNSERDLPMDLSQALAKRGLRLMLYTAAPGLYGLPLPSGMDRATAYRLWPDVMQWDSDHYGEACSGWWVDGLGNFVPDHVRNFNAALRHGNPNTIIAGGGYELSDFTHGHCNADWTAQQKILPYFGRWDPEYKIQWHQFQFIGPDWGQPGVAHSTSDMVAYMKKIVEGGGVMTFDLGTHDGRGNGPFLEIADDQMEQLCAIRDAVKDVPVSDGAKVRQKTLQRLLMNVKDEFIQLYAAWPRHWTDTFTLQAPQDITIAGRVEDGVLVELDVTPADRRQEIKLPGQNGLYDDRSATKPFAWPGPQQSQLTAAGWKVSRLMPTAKILSAPYIGLAQDAGWEDVCTSEPSSAPAFISVDDLREPDGMVYLARNVRVAEDGAWILHVGHDGGARVFVDGNPVGGEAGEVNPTPCTRTRVRVALAAGEHEIVVAFDRAGGLGWGIYVTFEIPEGCGSPDEEAEFPEPV